MAAHGMAILFCRLRSQLPPETGHWNGILHFRTALHHEDLHFRTALQVCSSHALLKAPPLAESSGEDHEVKAPKKRAETWIQVEIHTFIALRHEMDSLFITSKSNKHLWEQISLKMRDRGFDRSPTMCTDKWRNLLKEYKKAKHQDNRGGGGSAKMSCYKDLEDLLRERAKIATYKSLLPPPAAVGAAGATAATLKVDTYINFSPKG